ncbi:MAG: hypothetical protein RML72_07125, partial [Bacteroidia bacterium]|nr:hypothetical protein [Bacteroidia bacterium]MDW8158632.1 hypothetical protein [Bacteroidia bacterium]
RSNRVQAVAIVNPNPDPPNSPNIERCGSGNATFTAQMGSNPGNIIHLFDMPAGGTPIATASAAPYLLTAPSVTATTTFYLQTTNTSKGCISNRKAVSLIILPKPQPPTGFAGSRCGTGPVTFSLNLGGASNMAARLYTSPSAINFVDEKASHPYILTFPDLSTTSTFYVSSFNIAQNCESDRVSIVAVLTPFPDPPVAHGNAARCGPGTVSLTAGMGTIQGDAIRFFNSATGGQLLAAISTPFNNDPNNKLYSYPTPQLTTTTTFWAEVLNTIPNCTSLQRTPIVATVNPIPGLPLVEEVKRCGPGPVTISGNHGTPSPQNGVFRVYSSLSAPQPIYFSAGPPYSVSIPNVNTNSTFFVSILDLQTGCESGRVPVDITIHSFPDQPSANNVARCGEGTITFTAIQGASAGDEVRLYDSPTSTSPLVVVSTSPFLLRSNITNNATFYITAYNSQTGCESPRKMVEARVNPFPEPPTPNQSQRCGPGSVGIPVLPNLNNASQVNIYASASANVPIATLTGIPYMFTTSNLIQTTTFYATSVNSSTNCESIERVPILAIINPIPSVPEIEDVQRCGAGSVTFTIKMGNVPGTQVRMYTVNSSVLPPAIIDDSFPYEITTQAITTTTTFYFDVYNQSTTCVSSRKEAIAKVIPLPGAPSVTNTSRCGEGSVIILGEMGFPQGTTLRMYDAPFFGNLISADNLAPFELPTDLLTNTTTYYVESFDALTGCAGPRSPVVVTILPLPGVPPSQTLERCGPGSFSFSATLGNPPGNMISLYDAPIGGTPLLTTTDLPYLFNTPTLTSTTTYYLEVTNTLTGCISKQRSAIQLVINPLPSPPISGSFRRCQAGIATVTAQMGLVAGTEIRLYSNPIGGNPVSIDAIEPYELNTPPVASTRTFYLEVANTFTGCVSERTPAVVTVVEAPGMPIVRDVTRCGPGVVSLTVIMSPPLGDIIRAYDAPQNGNLIAADYSEPFIFSTSITATQTYYIESYNIQTQCASPRVQAFALVKPLPGKPIVENVYRCGPGEVTFTVSIESPGGTEVRLYASLGANNLIVSSGNFPFTLTSPYINTTTNFFFTSFDEATGCESNKIQATAVIEKIPAMPGAPNITVCALQGSTHPVTFSVAINNPNGTLLNLYTHQNATQAVAFTAQAPYHLSIDAPVGTFSTYFLEAVYTNTGCASKRVPVVATLNPIPSLPQTQNITICGSSIVTITAHYSGNGTPEIRLYTASMGTLPISFDKVPPYVINTPLLTQTTTLFLESYFHETNCSSNRVPVIVTVNPVPNLPLANNDGPKCKGEIFRLFVTSPLNNLSYHWQGPNDFSATGSQVSIPIPETGVYSVVAVTPEGCSSAAASTLVEVNPLPAEPVLGYYDEFGAQQHFLCEGRELNLMVINYPQYPRGTTFLWEGPNNFSSYPHPFP